ncbi:MAG: 5' nucleotidase, NT5C type [Candidatus Paceibacterota bacterium]
MSKKPFVLGVDLDGVCADYDGAMRDHVSKFLNVDRDSIPVTTDWSLVTSGWPLRDEKHFIDIHNKAVVEKRMFMTMDPIEGASDALWELSDLGVRIRIITFRLIVNGTHTIVGGDTLQWLSLPRPDNRPLIPFRDVCFLKDKSALGDVDLLIDDAPHNVLSVRKAHGEERAMIFDQPYNQDVGGLRAYNWRDVVDEVKRRLG